MPMMQSPAVNVNARILLISLFKTSILAESDLTLNQTLCGRSLFRSTAREPSLMFDLSTATILVVDDEPDMLTFISTVLEDSGAAVCRAQNGDEALEAARREQPDLITLDLAMPGKDGGQVFEELRNDPALAAMPVFIISGRPELRRLIYQKALRPPEGYLDKPIDEKSLLLNIRKILSLRQKS